MKTITIRFDPATQEFSFVNDRGARVAFISRDRAMEAAREIFGKDVRFDNELTIKLC